MSRFIKTIQLSLIAMLLAWVMTGKVYAQQSAPKDDNPPAKQDKSNGFGDVMLKLGKGLLKEVSRRLNLEESEVVTVKKEVTADGRDKYRVDTGKFSFTVRKKSKVDTTGKE